MLYIVNKKTKQLEEIEESIFQELKVWERRDLEQWVQEYPALLGEELFVVTTEYDKFDKSNDRLDVLAIDRQGKIVIIELKRDLAPSTTEMQGIKYAAFCSNLTIEDVVDIYCEGSKKKGDKVTPDDVENQIIDFIQDDNFEDFNNQPRIILVAREYKQDTTSSILWLRSFGVDIACVKLELYSLRNHAGENPIAIKPTTIIPLPEAEDFIVGRERKETTAAGITKRQKFFLDFYGRLIERFKKECPGITDRSATKDGWCWLPVGCSGIHFEWWFRKKPTNLFEIGLHLEKLEKAENQKILAAFEKIKDTLEEKLSEKLNFEYEWGKKWCKMYVENEEVEDMAKLDDWIIETTKKFYKHVKPELDRIMGK
ncbi:MAG: DUF4268 domain-containing protein [Nanoarchaeota archaeon]|nr:DUF4268 domain-containing protein [Nanoarchaeota archaeon]